MTKIDQELVEPALFLTDDDVARVATIDGAIVALSDAYATPQVEDSTPSRAVATTSTGWMRVMPSAPTGSGLAGLKVISAAVAKGQVSYLISLFDQETSSLIAQMDGNHITGMRTAATAAVAAGHMMSLAPSTVAVIGSGFEAREQLRALARVTELTEVRVYSPTPRNRSSFAQEMSTELGCRIDPVDSAQIAARGADLIVCAARSRDESPTIRSDWVGSTARIISVGSTTKSQRELDVDILDRAELIIADTLDEVVRDSGDMVAATEAGVDVTSKTVSLNEVVAGSVNARDTTGVTVYKSAGSGFQDVVLAGYALRMAREQGVGTVMPTGILTIRK